MTDLEHIAKQIERLARAVERQAEQLAYAAMPAVMKKTRAARELGCSTSTLNRLIKAGEIRVNKRGLVPAAEVLRFAAVEGRERPRAKVAKYDAQDVAQGIRALRVP